MTDGPACYRDRIPGHVADETVVQLSLDGSLSTFQVNGHPEVAARDGERGVIVLEGPGSMKIRDKH